MIQQNLAYRLDTLAFQYGLTGTLGPNSRKGEMSGQDTLDMMGLALATDVFRESDNTSTDLEPSLGHVRLLGDQPGDEVKGEFKIVEGESFYGRAETTEGSARHTWALSMDNNLGTAFILEDKGETFLATAMQLTPDGGDGTKTVRTGTWSELPDGVF